MRSLSLLLATAFLLSLPCRAEEADGSEQLPATIEEVRIHLTSVLWVTRRSVILRELPWKEGETVTANQWQLGITRLWNTGLFSRISARVVREGDRRVAVLDLEDRLTLNPLFKFAFEGGGSGILPSGGAPPLYWFHLGASDPNLFGTFLEGGFTYEMFGENPGGRVWFHDPRLFDKRLDGWFEVNYLPRPRPGFVLFRGTARAQVSYEVNDLFSVLGRVDGILDRFVAPPPDTGPYLRQHPGEGALVSLSVKYGRVDTVRLFQKGWSAELQPLFGFTNDPTHPRFNQVLFQLLGFVPVGSWLNLAFRVHAGGSEPAPTQDLLYIGGLGDAALGGLWDHTVRGLPDNAITTNAFAMVNAEARFLAFDSTWLALMPAVFVDGVIAAASPVASGSTPNLNGPPQRAVSVGAGVRILIPRFVGTGLRIDGAYVLGEPLYVQSWYSVGVYQLF
jgi:hypothetical protein